MQSAYRTQTNLSLHYDPVTITLHWITVVLIGLLWTIGQTIDFAPSGPLRVDYRSLHIVLGLLMAGVFFARFGWRMTRGRALPPEGNVWFARVASLVHWMLYVLIAITLVLGLANVWMRGDLIFNLFQVPSFDPSNQSLRRLIGGWHALAANAILIVVGLHAAAALMHHYVLRDGVLRRMLPMA